MEQYRTIAVIESNYQNRAKVTNALFSGGYHAEPYEEIEEFISESRDGYVVLISDVDGNIDRLPDLESVVNVINSNQPERKKLVETGRMRANARAKMVLLTKREREVLQCMSEGMSNKVIGLKLGISPRTVEIHRANMITKLETESTNEALRLAAYAEI